MAISTNANLFLVQITVDAIYKNTGYKNMPVIRTLTRFTESLCSTSLISCRI